jgi:catechol 2,3-dioxygenase-like lactoylglutathione lyase family enzyme
MFDRVTIYASDLEASQRFYDAVLRTIGGGRDDFSLAAATAGQPGTRRLQIAGEDGSFSVVAGEPTERVHMAFRADEADTFVDPDGNTVELVGR